MDFQGMKRKDLQALCKKHGVPANLKNIEMATRLASVFEEENEEIVTETKKLLEDTVEVEDSDDNLVVGRKAKKVRFSPENEVFEFTRSVKQQRKRRNVRSRSEIEVRRSTRIAAKGVMVAESSENELNSIREIVESPEKECVLLDATDVQKVPRRSKRIGSSGSTQEGECRVLELIDLEQSDSKDISKGLSGNNQDGFEVEKVERRSTRLIAKRSKGHVDNEDKEDELVENNGKEVSMDFEVQETGKYQSKDLQDPTVEKVPRRSRRFASEIDVQVPTVEKVRRRSSRFASKIDVQTNTQDRRKSMRLKANPSMGGETSDGRPLCSAKESKEERKTKQSKRSVAVNSQEGELVKNKAKEPLIDCEVQKMDCTMKVQDDSGVGKVPRRSKRFGNDVNVLMDKRPLVDEIVKAVNHDDQAHKDDEQLKRPSGNDCEDEKLLRRSKRTALDNMRGQAMANSPKRCSVIHRKERDGASVDNVKKLNVNDEMQVRVRFTRNSSRIGSCKAPVVVEGNPVEKKVDGTFDSLVKSSKKVAKKMKRDRSAEPVIDIETAVTQSNLTPEKLLDEYGQFEQKAGEANVEAKVSSKKSKIVNQECFTNKPEGMIEDSPSSSKTKAAEFVMIIENVLDSTTQQCGSELVEGEHVEKNEQDIVLMAATKEKEDASMMSVSLIKCSELKTFPNDRSAGSYLSVETTLPPTSLQLAMSNPEAELGIPTVHILVKDIVSTVITEEDTKSKEDNLICTPRTDLAKVEERNLMLMEQLGEDGMMHAVDSVTHQNDEAEESRAVVFTTPEKVLLLGDFELDEAEKEEVHTATEFPDVYDALNATETPGKSEARNEGESIVVELHDECNITTSAVRQSSVEDVKGDGIRRNLMLMEQVSENGKIRSTQSVSHLNDEAIESHAIVFTTPEKALLLGDSELDETEKEEDHTATKFPGYLSEETTLRPPSSRLAMSDREAELGISNGHNLVKDIVSTVITEEDTKTQEDIVICTPRTDLKQRSSVANLAKAEVTLENLAECGKEIHSRIDDEKGSLEKDLIALSEEEKLGRDTVLMALSEEEKEEVSSRSVLLIERVSPASVKLAVSKPATELVMPTGHILVKDTTSTALVAPIVVEGNSVEKKIDETLDSFFKPSNKRGRSAELGMDIETAVTQSNLNPEKLVEEYAQFEQEDARGVDVETVNQECITDRPEGMIEDSPSSSETKAAESGMIIEDVLDSTLLVDSSQRTNTQVLNSEIMEGESGEKLEQDPVLVALIEEEKEELSSRSVLLIEPEPPASVQLAGSNLDHTLAKDITSTGNAEENTKIKDHSPTSELKEHSAETKLVKVEAILENLAECWKKIHSRKDDEEGSLDKEVQAANLHDEAEGDEAVESHAIGFTTPEKVLFLGDSEIDEAGKEEDFTALNFRENTNIDSNDRTASKVSYSHEFSVGKETAGTEFTPNGPQAENVLGPFAFNIQEVETIIEAERNVSLNSYVLALPAKDDSCEELRNEDNSEKIGEISSHVEDAGTCSMVSEEAGPSIDIQNYLNGPLEEFAIKDNNEADEHIEAKVTKITQVDCEGNLLLDCCGNSSASVKTSVLAGMEYEHLGLDSEVEFRNTCEKSGHKSLENEATGQLATAFEETMSLTPGESTVQNNINEEAADEEVIRRETTTPSPEETMKEYSNTYESGTLSEKQVRREPLLIYGTQMKPIQNMKENAQNTCEKSGPKSLEDEATDPTATAFEEAISVTPDEFTVQNNTNEEAANEEVIRRETTTPSHEDTMNEHSNTYESGMLSEKQVRGESLLIYGTQVKPNAINMKENGQNSKIVHNLNITAPRTTKRKPLQDVRNN